MNGKRILLTLEQTRVLIDIGSRLEAVLGNLQDMNTLFPETRSFLKSRGLEHIRQLDKRGRRELEKHLKDVLTSIRPVLH